MTSSERFGWVHDAVVLPVEENEQIFREQIVPDLLAAVPTQEHPRVIFVVGQPGAGKTATRTAITDVWGQTAAPACVDADILKAYHPAYADLLAEDDTRAAVRVSADGRLWTAKAEAWLISKRANVLIEETTRNPRYFLGEQLQRYRGTGAYRVDVAVLAVPEAWSRLGILARYAQQLDVKGTGRLTPTANHDASHEAIETVMQALDQDPLVDVVGVFRRGNEQLYGNHVNSRGDWTHPPGAHAALQAERSRPWTVQESTTFLADLQQLRTSTSPDVRRAVPALQDLAQPFLAPETKAQDLVVQPGTRPAAERDRRSTRPSREHERISRTPPPHGRAPGR